MSESGATGGERSRSAEGELEAQGLEWIRLTAT